MIVEDGTGVAGANSYVTLNAAIEYALARGLTFAGSPSLPGEQALIRATSALDAVYRGRFGGYKTNGRDQALEWPRTEVYDYNGDAIASDEIPYEIIRATIEIAVREFATPGSFLPDLERGGGIQSLKAGSVGITYFANAGAQTTFTLIDGILSGLLGQAQSSLVGTAVRG